MLEQGVYGRRVGRHFFQENPPTIVVKASQRAALAVTRLRCDTGLSELTKPLPREKAYLIVLQLHDLPSPQIWVDGEQTPAGPHLQGAVSVLDLEREVRVLFPSPFDCLQFYVPRSALDDIADEYGVERIDGLSWPCGRVDPVALQLALPIVPVLDSPVCTNRLLVNHVTQAMVAHFACSYGGMTLTGPSPNNGLAPWQMRRVTAYLEANIDGEVSVSRLASECRLSRSHFAHAFKQTTGQPPHRWLLTLRVGKAKNLMLESDMPLTDVALACGFADQSHFTRVFTGSVGTSPGTWRRARKS